jgi:hypothetical protein
MNKREVQLRKALEKADMFLDMAGKRDNVARKNVAEALRANAAAIDRCAASELTLLHAEQERHISTGLYNKAGYAYDKMQYQLTKFLSGQDR